MIDEMTPDILDTDGEDFFDDIFTEDESAVEETSEEIPAEIEESPAEVAEEAPKTYAYKVLNNEKQLDAASVDTLAAALGIEPQALIANLQKGEDYDRKTQRYEAQKPIVQAVEAFANQRGISVDEAAKQMAELTGRLEALQKAADIRQRAEAARVKFPGMAEAAAQHMAELETEKLRLEQENARRESEVKQQEALRKPLNDFFVAHPEFIQNELPQRFKELYNSGMTPNEAYLTMKAEEATAELEALKQQNAIEEQRRAAAAKTPGTMIAEAGEKAEDAFLAGFFG